MLIVNVAQDALVHFTLVLAAPAEGLRSSNLPSQGEQIFLGQLAESGGWTALASGLVAGSWAEDAEIRIVVSGVTLLPEPVDLGDIGEFDGVSGSDPNQDRRWTAVIAAPLVYSQAEIQPSLTVAEQLDWEDISSVRAKK
ncbi:hypothetical protein [Pelagibacterium halotolerans]|uniref:hypothetical protein n=1 Tax=Pelagibacterium halotolerans TaxID=531813 RepID=UPI0005A11325|nr:hypothetical protein [Pelagibacterium halotolerans]QJR17444.1 hypothetical protein HKM20_02630 [Pelagibacterium halotolerans]QJR17445.1 hypothetical protein HKM20_02660 [Pelagibacterium halotolerans]SEA74305.1 hypothetical protein SAMN05428936_10780 [Pelagibacterium halotolerans]